MRAYADTSWWIGWNVSGDALHTKAISIGDNLEEIEVVWTPWQRVEVFNGIRQLDRRGAIEPNGAKQLIRALETEVQLGYWPHVEFSWTNAIRRATELSANHSPALAIRGMDLFHVAIALEIEADLLLTFDGDQAALAEAAGISVHSWSDCVE